MLVNSRHSNGILVALFFTVDQIKPGFQLDPPESWDREGLHLRTADSTAAAKYIRR